MSERLRHRRQYRPRGDGPQRPGRPPPRPAARRRTGARRRRGRDHRSPARGPPPHRRRRHRRLVRSLQKERQAHESGDGRSPTRCWPSRSPTARTPPAWCPSAGRRSPPKAAWTSPATTTTVAPVVRSLRDAPAFACPCSSTRIRCRWPSPRRSAPRWSGSSTPWRLVRSRPHRRGREGAGRRAFRRLGRRAPGP